MATPTAPTRTRLMGWGLAIDADVPVPGATPLPAFAPDTPSIRVRYGDADMAAPLRRDGPYTLGHDLLQFVAPGVAGFGVRRDGVTVAPDFAVQDGDAVSGLLVATALPALLWMRGDVVLHASAVRSREGRVVAILGPSGSGKSTALHAFVCAGAQVIADDTIRIAHDAPPTRISGLPGGYFRSGHPHTTERRLMPVPRDRQLAVASLDLIVELAGDADNSFAPLGPAAALATLLRHRHRPRAARILNREPATLARLAALAALVPVRRWPAATMGGSSISALVDAVAHR